MLKRHIFLLVFLCTLGVISNSIFAQKIGPLPSDVTKRSAKEVRDEFFNNAGVQKKFGIVMREAARRDKENGEAVLVPALEKRMFEKWNQSSTEWLQSHRGISLEFADDMTAYEKAAYNSKLIGFLRDMQEAGVSEDAREGKNLALKIKIYRNAEQYELLRKKFGKEGSPDDLGDGLLASLGVNRPGGVIYQGPRTLIIDRDDPTIQDFYGDYRLLFERIDNRDRLKMLNPLGQVDGFVYLKPSPDLELAKNLKLDPKNWSMTKGRDSIMRLTAESATLNAWELGNEVLVVTKDVPGEANANRQALYKNQWKRVSMQNGLKSLVPVEDYNLFSSANLVIANDPRQLAAIYYAADPAFRKAVNKVEGKRAQNELDKILEANQIEKQKNGAASKADLNFLLNSLEDPSCLKDPNNP